MKIIPKYNLEYTIDIKPRWWDNTSKLKVIIGIASALCHMFLFNISHYNLNTENIYLDEKAEPVICNFGYLNKLIIDEQKEKIPNIHKFVCMAPELFIKEKFSDYKFEINSYSFGILLYQILTNTTLGFVYRNSYDLKMMINDKFNNYVPKLPDDMDPLFKDIIVRCLNSSFNERPDPISIYNDLIDAIQSNTKLLPNVNHNSIIEYIKKLPDMKALVSKPSIQKYFIHSPELNKKVNELQIDLNPTNPKINFKNNKFDDLIKEYSFQYISTENKFEEIQQTCKNITESKLLIIDHQYQKQKENSILSELHFILSFQKTVIFIVKEMLFSFLKFVYQNNEEIKLCFLKSTKDIFDECIKIKYAEFPLENEFENDVLKICKQLSIQQKNDCKCKDIWTTILPSISSFLLGESYYKTHIDRIYNFYISKSKKSEDKIIDNYIELHQIEGGFFYEVKLIYLISDGKLAVIKKLVTKNKKTQKIMEQDEYNFHQFDHPFIAKIYGKTSDKMGVL